MVTPESPRRDWKECLLYSYEDDPLPIELRHLLGDRDWPGYGDVEPIRLPAARSLWPSVEAAWEAIRPHVERFEASAPPEQMALGL